MSYEIPPPLQHKEKIIFSLTFEQLIYSGIALLLSVIILKFISISVVKWSLISVILVITILMFFSVKFGFIIFLEQRPK